MGLILFSTPPPDDDDDVAIESEDEFFFVRIADQKSNESGDNRLMNRARSTTKGGGDGDGDCADLDNVRGEINGISKYDS